MLGRLFTKIKKGLTKTRNVFSGIVDLFTGNHRVDKEFLGKLEEQLYLADVGTVATAEIIERVRQGFLDKEVGEDVKLFVRQELRNLLADPSEGIHYAPNGPTVIMIAGVNGSGKTTSIAKLAFRLQSEGKKVCVAACDTFRAAAVEQLKAWATRLELDIVASHSGADAAAVAFDAWQAASARGKDFLIVDTAGRLHTKDHLMQELAKIRRVLQKNDPTAPQHRWLVVDGSIGSNSIEQARVFHQSFGLTGLVVTKLDGTSRGGALVGIWRQLKIPIYFLGLGEQAEDLQPFSVDNYGRAVFGLE